MPAGYSIDALLFQRAMIDARIVTCFLERFVDDLRPALAPKLNRSAFTIVPLPGFFAELTSFKNSSSRHQNVRVHVLLIAIFTWRMNRDIDCDTVLFNQFTRELRQQRLLLLQRQLVRQRNFNFTRNCRVFTRLSKLCC
ncbi:hypothetical protein Tsedi_02400 [Tepidimonas sediminis]|uniref:Uncharacterized protein n=1 Tax=Tepidimonas sediminis TaxID=2588941 RepID=A0A554WER8_9BURK|nr:hypothetical protein Tsedi_02400 [Tepidimonas sediminis]